MSYRIRQRGRLILMSERDVNGRPLCWLCGERVGAHMHEYVNRAQTMGNDDAREASFQAELCALLCLECHDQAPRIAVEETLWRTSYRVWGYGNEQRGYNAVRAALDSLNSHLQSPVVVHLPDPRLGDKTTHETLRGDP